MAYAKFHPIRTAIKVDAIVKLYTTAQKGFRLAKAIELGIENPQIISGLIAVSIGVTHKVAEETQKCIHSDKCPVPKDKAVAFNKILQDKFAEHSMPYPVYDGDDTIPPLGKDEQDTSTPDYNKDLGEHDNHLITTPSGEQIDPREEFPMEDIKTYDDYILAKSNAQKLADNLIKANEQKLANTVAHHIVPVTSQATKNARIIFQLINLDINSALNGVFLPDKNNSNLNQLIHNGRHPDLYVQKIDQIIVDAYKSGGEKKVYSELERVKSIFKNTNKNDTWNDIVNRM